jgi:Zn-dependent M28 family amino/carboxypeptidase
MDEARANDYLFIAFSGEEKGLYGSNYWTKHPTLPIEHLNYMINLDMVGRVDSSERHRHQRRGHLTRVGGSGPCLIGG